jgi:hypothetical protein
VPTDADDELGLASGVAAAGSDAGSAGAAPESGESEDAGAPAPLGAGSVLS